jgi:hypothetical protein
MKSHSVRLPDSGRIVDITNRDPTGQNSLEKTFNKNNACSYLIDGPSSAKYGDMIKLRWNFANQTNAYFYQGDQFDKKTQGTYKKMAVNTTYVITLPNRIWISAWGQGKTS